MTPNYLDANIFTEFVEFVVRQEIRFLKFYYGYIGSKTSVK